ncbi:MAG: carbohydrate ABC transporter permease [Lachnospiraceae bacterium]|uniref:carbohydrate ABC transporter permease n=1 Tax=uncultured Acetatifactor sp. TaxID=1671927 RepID=UPI00265F24EC|nr:carbohydrate ABC transporter permease [uncultured Acetatifactor sp.]MCI8788023.1 carbohydrate ABC transporter permease [Lachnospiraceae bacterium]
MKSRKQSEPQKQQKPSVRYKAAAAPRRKIDKYTVKRWIFGSKDTQGAGKLAVIYGLLICIGFVYLYPLLYMIAKSLMQRADLLDSSVNWIPSTLYVKNYVDAFTSMDFVRTLWQSVVVAGLPTLLNMVMCAVIGYGFARYEFPLKKVMLGILIFSFIIPPQITMMPNYLLYNDLHILDSIKAFLLPAFLGQGIKAQLYILIFFQFFRQIPQALIEAAKIDGCGHFKTFFKIAVPSATPAILVVFLFSLVWYWNESYLTQLYVCGVLGDSYWNTLMVALKGFNDSYSQAGGSVTGEAMGSLNEGIKMAATMLSILPVLLLYFVLQKQFVESVDRTGITGE